MKNSRSTILILAGVVVVALVLWLLVPSPQDKKLSTSNSESAQALQPKVTAKGVVESLEDIELGSRVASVIRSAAVDDGDRIEKGQHLLQLDDDKVRAQLAQARAMVREAKAGFKRLESGYRIEDVAIAKARVRQLESVSRQAEDEFSRQDRLYHKQAVTLLVRNRAEERMQVAAEDLAGARVNLKKLQTGERQEDLESARAAVARSMAELSYYQALLSDFTVKSPIDGVVSVRLREPGESVDIGTPLLKIFNPERLRIRAELEETEVDKVIVDQLAEVTCDAFPGKVFCGRVSQVFSDVRKKSQKTFDPMASFDINTQTLHVVLDDFGGLKHGMTVTVSFF
jgi:HlyD family secretion protein